MSISIKEIEYVDMMLKTDMTVDITQFGITIQCNNKCRLLSHLLHKAGLTDIHCNKDGFFDVRFSTYDFSQILAGFEKIIDNPQWIVEFVEKYIDNEFVMNVTFKASEVEA